MAEDRNKSTQSDVRHHAMQAEGGAITVAGFGSTEALWPDDLVLQGSDGFSAQLGGGPIYSVSRSLLASRPDLLKVNKAILTEYILDNGGADIGTGNIDAILSRRLPSVRQKVDRLLRALANRTAYQAGSIRLVHGGQRRELLPLMRETGASTEGELKSLLQYAESKGLATFAEASGMAEAGITIPGVIYVEGLDVPSADSSYGFVAMWFNQDMAPAYEAIAHAIEANGYQPDRVDKREFNHKIDDEIVARIRAARFVVADFSCGEDGARGGVYFEAGFGQGLDKEVIFTVRESDLSRVHFDTRQFNHIAWTSEADLEERLKN